MMSFINAKTFFQQVLYLIRAESIYSSIDLERKLAFLENAVEIYNDNTQIKARFLNSDSTYYFDSIEVQDGFGKIDTRYPSNNGGYPTGGLNSISNAQYMLSGVLPVSIRIAPIADFADCITYLGLAAFPEFISLDPQSRELWVYPIPATGVQFKIVGKMYLPKVELVVEDNEFSFNPPVIVNESERLLANIIKYNVARELGILLGIGIEQLAIIEKNIIRFENEATNIYKPSIKTKVNPPEVGDLHFGTNPLLIKKPFIRYP